MKNAIGTDFFRPCNGPGIKGNKFPNLIDGQGFDPFFIGKGSDWFTIDQKKRGQLNRDWGSGLMDGPNRVFP